MEDNQKYVVLSLELHLFFARIMKEHSLFLEAGFTPQGAALAAEAEAFKNEFENLLFHVVRLSDCVVHPNVINSGEIVTEFTMKAEQQTQKFTGIGIEQKITGMELQLNGCTNPAISRELVQQVRHINKVAVQLLDGLIELKERILLDVTSCCLFTMNYPLLIKHIIREAKLYRTYVINYENGRDFDCQNMKQVEQFWNQIMMEHALFIRGLLDPSENELINAADSFAHDYACLLEKSKEMNDRTIMIAEDCSLQETLKFRDFKSAGTEGIENCEIRSIILPLLADHVLREANHYIRLMKD